MYVYNILKFHWAIYYRTGDMVPPADPLNNKDRKTCLVSFYSSQRGLYYPVFKFDLNIKAAPKLMSVANVVFSYTFPNSTTV